MVRVLFAHGLESGPEGRKTAWLRDAGHDVRAPDCRGLDLAARIEILIAALADDAGAPRIVVGSSFGGIAALVAAIAAARVGSGPSRIVLCAPALQLPVPPPYPNELAPPCPAIVVHGVRDEIIPIEVSRAWCRQHAMRLVECDDDHGLGRSREAILAALVA